MIIFDQFFIKKLNGYNPMIKKKGSRKIRKILLLLLLLLLFSICFIIKKPKNKPRPPPNVITKSEDIKNELQNEISQINDNEGDIGAEISIFDRLMSEIKNEKSNTFKSENSMNVKENPNKKVTGIKNGLNESINDYRERMSRNFSGKENINRLQLKSLNSTHHLSEYNPKPSNGKLMGITDGMYDTYGSTFNGFNYKRQNELKLKELDEQIKSLKSKNNRQKFNEIKESSPILFEWLQHPQESETDSSPLKLKKLKIKEAEATFKALDEKPLKLSEKEKKTQESTLTKKNQKEEAESNKENAYFFWPDHNSAKAAIQRSLNFRNTPKEQDSLQSIPVLKRNDNVNNEIKQIKVPETQPASRINSLIKEKQELNDEEIYRNKLKCENLIQELKATEPYHPNFDTSKFKNLTDEKLVEKMNSKFYNQNSSYYSKIYNEHPELAVESYNNDNKIREQMNLNSLGINPYPSLINKTYKLNQGKSNDGIIKDLNINQSSKFNLKEYKIDNIKSSFIDKSPKSNLEQWNIDDRIKDLDIKPTFIDESLNSNLEKYTSDIKVSNTEFIDQTSIKKSFKPNFENLKNSHHKQLSEKTGDYRTNLKMVEINKKLNFIDENFTFENFIKNPTSCVKNLETNNIFKVEHVPKTILTYLEKRKNMNKGFIGNFLRELLATDQSGNRYDEKNVEKAFNNWKETIKQSIKNGLDRIEVKDDDCLNKASKAILEKTILSSVLTSENDYQNTNNEIQLNARDLLNIDENLISNTPNPAIYH